MKQFQTYLNKMVSVTTFDGRDNFGKRNGSKEVVTGICYFLGPNNHIGVPLQITVGRRPIAIDSLNQIKVVPHLDKPRFTKSDD